jgi:hypothetical protein
MPEEEEAELATIYRSKGFSASEARTIAHRIIQDPTTARDRLVREELGLDPAQLRSPIRAAARPVPRLRRGADRAGHPYLLGGGDLAFRISLVASLAVLFLVGAGVSLLTGRSTLFLPARQVASGPPRRHVRRRPRHRGLGRVISHASPARLLAIALLMATIAVGLMLVLLHSALIPAVAGGFIFGALFLFVATGIGGDPEAADAAWRAEAADLASHPPSPTALAAPGSEPATRRGPITTAEPVTMAGR